MLWVWSEVVWLGAGTLAGRAALAYQAIHAQLIRFKAQHPMYITCVEWLKGHRVIKIYKMTRNMNMITVKWEDGWSKQWHNNNNRNLGKMRTFREQRRWVGSPKHFKKIKRKEIAKVISSECQISQLVSKPNCYLSIF